jgi:uncharacterized membrane protein
MKKYYVLSLLIMTSIFFSYCHSSKKAMANKVAPKLNYETNVQMLVATKCTPCHFPAKGGNKKPLDTYAAVQENIDDILRRIQLNPTDRGFMPFKNAKLSDSAIAVFTQWKADGMLQK